MAATFSETIRHGYQPAVIIFGMMYNEDTLLKVNADQGRLGGLFKLWLSGKSTPSAEALEIRKLLAAIEESQLKLKAAIGRLPG